ALAAVFDLTPCVIGIFHLGQIGAMGGHLLMIDLHLIFSVGIAIGAQLGVIDERGNHADGTLLLPVGQILGQFLATHGSGLVWVSLRGQVAVEVFEVAILIFDGGLLGLSVLQEPGQGLINTNFFAAILCL